MTAEQIKKAILNYELRIENCKYVRLGEVAEIIRGITFPSSEKYKVRRDGLVCCATTGSVQKEYNYIADVFVLEKFVKNEKQWLQKNDIIMSSANSRELVGKTCMWNENEKKTFGGFLTVIRTNEKCLAKFCYFVLQVLWMNGVFNENSTQTTNIANINNAILSNTLIPFPPLSKQKGIVKKLERLMPLVERYGECEKNLTAINAKFPEQIRKAVLQRYISNENYELVKLGEVVDIIRGITFPSSEKYKVRRDGLVCCATTGSVQKEYNCIADVFVLEKFVKNEKQWLQKNDIIMSSANSRELVGKTCLWNENEKKTFGGFLTVIRTNEKCLSKFCYFVLQVLWMNGVFNKNSTQTTNIANINNAILSNTLIPLPPLSKQKLIVAKIEKIFAKVDKLTHN